MPHVIAEYSANIEEKIRIETLLEVLHDAMMESGVAELAGLRTRAERRDQFRIADNDPANGFVNITIRLAQGRSLEMRKLVAQTVFTAASRHLERVFATTPFVLSVEVQEIDPELRLHHSNIRTWMKAREPAA
jgi:5-carboxymethyl-2-hydroxymuconate isomerase